MPVNQKQGRVFRFAQCEFDELARQLKVSGEPVDLESKPLDVLLHLLLHAGEVVTKEELLDAVWPGVVVVEGSLPTAVSKLRKALRDDDQNLIVTIPRIGYRLGVPVQTQSVEAALPELGFESGQPVPGRPQWILAERLDVSLSSEVWLANHAKTAERRVFKFASDGIRLRGLKREVTLARLLRETLGDRPDFVRILEWNFDTAPYFLESEYGGVTLDQWMASASPSPETRLAIYVSVVQAMAAAHEAGVLHKDLKPANILVMCEDQAKIADFGSGAVLEPNRLDALNITNLGFTISETNPRTGTLMYMAPEVLAGQSPTAVADVYALGVILYQLVIGDFRKPIAPGWEAGISDPLLREDIADAAAGDPSRRLPTVAALLQRLRSLDLRRAQRSELELAKQRAEQAEQRLARARARRPWAIAALLFLGAGLAASLVLYQRAVRQTAIADAVNRFLAGDLLGRSDPFQSGAAKETLADAIRNAAPNIDRRFEGAPEVAARLHHTIARALDQRTDYAAARREYERASALYRQAEGEASPNDVIVQLQRVAMEARTYEDGSLPRAKALLESQESRLAKLSSKPAELDVWLASARAMVALIGNDAKSAATQFQSAVDAARSLPEFDQAARLTLEQRLGFSYIRLGDGAHAEQRFRELIPAFTKLDGPEAPSVLRVRLNLAQAYMIQNKHKESVAETTAIYPAYVARLGEDHELSMQVLTTRAQSEGALGMWDAAIRDDLKIHELAVKKQGPRSFFAIATLSDASLAQCRAGRPAEGASNAGRAYDASRQAFGPRAGLTGGVAHSLASCLIELGQLDRASQLLADIDGPAVAQLAGDKDWYANVELSLADIALRRSDRAAARKHLDAAAPVFQRPEAEAFQKRAYERLRAASN